MRVFILTVKLDVVLSSMKCLSRGQAAFRVKKSSQGQVLSALQAPDSRLLLSVQRQPAEGSYLCAVFLARYLHLCLVSYR